MRWLRATMVLVILTTSGLIPVLPKLFLAVVEAGVTHLAASDPCAGEAGDPCAQDEEDSECPCCPSPYAGCPCAPIRALAVVPGLIFQEITMAREPALPEQRSLVSQQSAGGIFHPPRA